MRASVYILALTATMIAAPVQAQQSTAKPAKAAAKPVEPAKPKAKLMTRDELRACFERRDANIAESKAIEAADAELLKERNEVLATRDALQAKNVALNEAEKALVAENQAMTKVFEELKSKLPDMSKKERALATADYEKRAAEVNAKIDPHNQRKRDLIAESQAFEQRIDAFNKRKDVLAERADKLGEAQDAWRVECGSRPYDERDELALKKEAEAKKKAESQ